MYFGQKYSKKYGTKDSWCDQLNSVALKSTVSAVGNNNLKRNYCYPVEILLEIYLPILLSFFSRSKKSVTAYWLDFFPKEKIFGLGQCLKVLLPVHPLLVLVMLDDYDRYRNR